MAIGAPDFTNYTRPNRTILGEGQTRYTVNSSQNVASGGALQVAITPSSGYRLNVALVIISCQSSVIQRGDVDIDGTYAIIADFDTVLVIPFPETACPVITSSETITITAVNNDYVARNMRISVLGTTEAV